MAVISVNREQKIVSVIYSGFYGVADVRDHADKLRMVISREFGKTPHFSIMMDMIDCSVQSQETTSCFQAQLKGFPKAARIAIITESALAKIQMSRLMGYSNLKIFDHKEKALTWLIAKDIDSPEHW